MEVALVSLVHLGTVCVGLVAGVVTWTHRTLLPPMHLSRRTVVVGGPPRSSIEAEPPGPGV